MSSFLLVIVATFWVLARDKTLLSALFHHSFLQPSATRLEVGPVTHSPILQMRTLRLGKQHRKEEAAEGVRQKSLLSEHSYLTTVALSIPSIF